MRWGTLAVEDPLNWRECRSLQSVDTAVRRRAQNGRSAKRCSYAYTSQYANNRIEWDHGRLKATGFSDRSQQLRPMPGLGTDRTASPAIRGHAFVQNVRRDHYELGVDARHERLRLAAAFDELTAAI